MIQPSLKMIFNNYSTIFKNIFSLKKQWQKKLNVSFAWPNKNVNKSFVIKDLMRKQINVLFTCVNNVIQQINIKIKINVHIYVRDVF